MDTATAAAAATTMTKADWVAKGRGMVYSGNFSSHSDPVINSWIDEGIDQAWASISKCYGDDSGEEIPGIHCIYGLLDD